MIEGFRQIYFIQALKLQSYSTFGTPYKKTLDDRLLYLPRSLIYCLLCQLDCYLVAIIGLGGFQKKHATYRHRIASSPFMRLHHRKLRPTSIRVRGLQLVISFRPVLRLPHQVPTS